LPQKNFAGHSTGSNLREADRPVGPRSIRPKPESSVGRRTRPATQRRSFSSVPVDIRDPPGAGGRALRCVGQVTASTRSPDPSPRNGCRHPRAPAQEQCPRAAGVGSPGTGRRNAIVAPGGQTGHRFRALSRRPLTCPGDERLSHRKSSEAHRFQQALTCTASPCCVRISIGRPSMAWLLRATTRTFTAPPPRRRLHRRLHFVTDTAR
jgi:hypothetical protein